MKSPPLEEILDQIKKSWVDISTELTKKSFIAWGISNNVDWSEDESTVLKKTKCKMVSKC